MSLKQLRGKEVKRYFKDQPKRYHEIVLVLENIQYAKNVANMFRTAESAGVEKILLTGISQRPPFGIGLKKVSRGSENKVKHEYFEKTLDILPTLKDAGYTILAIELADNNVPLSSLKEFLKDKPKVCLIAGNEDSGVNKSTLELCDNAVTIPMYGKNPSLNVNVSVGIVLFSF
ncbi:hypothetical protein A2415_03035 [candidate division WWE3 bacterium RIFOXYC1_FULL_39_7]|uniref:tRNA/rRNA methyltransferase SpoU type domain-containing protein n=2 Tax=Katanobacteria TaxID=422282 RepID=A0A1F4X8J1_UNCKA|nr:MAG: hypothetical protein A2415_03035 [candidate division WWE3 bacterium RIFOXYC1_FULL_39_7]OGC78007.1 MAG: hypothetical protein A2619_02890 [candidate division WWE3 bacterium RIFOXYD1_FULL_39_9]